MPFYQLPRCTYRFNRVVSRLLLFVRGAVSRFLKYRCLDNAAALTYTTLFAVVPLMTVTYSMLSTIPSFQEVGESVQNFIFHNFVPTAGEQLKEYLTNFSQQARQLTAIGVIFLMVTAFMMLKTVDRAINRIWQVDSIRRGVSGFLLYWAILSLGPFFIGIGFAATSYLTSIKLISDTTAYLGVDQWLLRLTPVLLSTTAFTLLYMAVPNRKVPFRHAFSGALFVAVCFELAKAGFALFIALSPSYRLIYGAFAAVPLFLLWIYLSWILVLFGAVLVRSFSLFDQVKEERLPAILSLLLVLDGFRQAFSRGESLSWKVLCEKGWCISLEDWEQHTALLIKLNIIDRNDRSELVLSYDLRALSLEALFQATAHPLPARNVLQAINLEERPEWFASVVNHLLQLDTLHKRELGAMLDEVFSS